MTTTQLDQLYDLVQALKRACEMAQALQDEPWSAEVIDVLINTEQVLSDHANRYELHIEEIDIQQELPL